jgi:diguanylate cyclase (GGDEF)-like protein
VLFGRIGGEEFAAMLPVGDIGEAVAIADRVRRNFVSAAAAHATDDLQPSVSVGVTLGCDPQTPMSDLLASADQALYRAKAKGRNRVEAAEPVVAAETVPLQPAAQSGERRRWRRVPA